MTHWNAVVELDGALGVDDVKALAARGDYIVVTVAQDPPRTRISFGVDASTLRRAVDEAWRRTREITAGVPSGPAVAIRVLSDEALAAELARPTVPELVDTTGARQILGVTTNQQFADLEARDDFPRPVAVISGGRRIYTVSSIHAFGQRWERRRGRPPKRP